MARKQLPAGSSCYGASLRGLCRPSLSSRASSAFIHSMRPSLSPRHKSYSTAACPSPGQQSRASKPLSSGPSNSLRGSRSVTFSTSALHRDAADPTSSAETPAVPKPVLTWDEFLKLRKRRRFINLAASAGTAIGSVSLAAPLAIQYEVEDKIAAITGLDPFIAFGLTITAVGGLGWLMGPFVGNAGFLFLNRGIKGEIAQKERAFYDHVKRFRADPASSSVNNPVPDYYGEKVGSVADYRRWLKDQRAFNRKKNKNML